MVITISLSVGCMCCPSIPLPVSGPSQSDTRWRWLAVARINRLVLTKWGKERACAVPATTIPRCFRVWNPLKQRGTFFKKKKKKKKQSACKQTHRKFAAVTCGACCNLKVFLRNKMLSRSYLIYLTKTFGSVNKIFGRVKKTIQAKTLVDSSKPVWLTEQKFGHLNQNVLWNQPNTVNQTILLNEPFFFWVQVYVADFVHPVICYNLSKNMWHVFFIHTRTLIRGVKKHP